MSVDIKVTIRPLPLFSKSGKGRIPFEHMAIAALPRNYELSLVICGDGLARRMNQTYRHKEYSPNVLSFPLDKKSGEIFLNVAKAKREARKFGTTLRARLALLFVHGLFHLNGLDHGEKMEREEQKILKKFRLAG